ncbi:MAG TPA: YraN family protein [Jatrophihabitantaceae bacterium]|jgi:putative endonuclease|nr:YraN family protein [Trebonia sp.]HZY75024.1 YraN family protein [Jatrophihabitantaceae bacterium]
MLVKDAVGHFGEDLAARHLEAAGLQLLSRNWRCSAGELDIVARDGDVICFVEVKTRSTTAFGDPVEAMTPAKVNRIHRLALRWLDEHRDSVRWGSLRFDVVSVVRLAPGGPVVEHLKGVF